MKIIRCEDFSHEKFTIQKFANFAIVKGVTGCNNYIHVPSLATLSVHGAGQIC